MKNDAEIKQTVIAILTAVRDGRVDPHAGLSSVPGPAENTGPLEQARAAEQARQQAVTAATYAMTLFQMLAAQFEASCPGVDVQAFLRRRALEAAVGDGEAA